jgi:hypothetical protein
LTLPVPIVEIYHCATHIKPKLLPTTGLLLLHAITTHHVLLLSTPAPLLHAPTAGTLMGPQEIGLLRQRVAAGQQPWAAAAKQLSQDTPLDYTPHALQNFDVGWNGAPAHVAVSIGARFNQAGLTCPVQC